MSHARRLATVTSAVVAALVVVLIIAPPAQAEGEVSVEIEGLSDSVQAGGSSFDDARATFTNETNGAISGVFAAIAVSMAGAPPEAIHVQRTPGVDLPRQNAGDGTVVFTDPTPFDLGRGGNDRRRLDFFVSFGDGVPEGTAGITVAAYVNGQLLGSDERSIEVRGGRASASNTATGFVPTFSAGPTYSVAPLDEAAGTTEDGSSVPAMVYVLGALLMIMGLTVLILTFWSPGQRGEHGHDAEPRRPMRWPGRRQSAAGPVGPRPPHPGPLTTSGVQQWPVVGQPPAPGQPAPYPGPPTGTGRHVREPHTGTGRPVRDPGPRTGTGRDTVPDEDPWR